MKSLVAMEVVERKILLIRGQKVILDVDLAELYGVTTKVFNQAVKRNIDRFPKDFMIQLTLKKPSPSGHNCDRFKKEHSLPGTVEQINDHISRRVSS